MKIIIAILLAAALLITVAAVTVSANTGTPTQIYVCGDADGDMIVTIYDVTEIQKLLADIIKDIDGMIALRGDVNNNGLDIIDASIIQRYLAEYEVSAPVGQLIGGPEPVTENQTEVQTEVQTQPPTQMPTKDLDELPFIPIK